nr:uncharacterized protein LOC127315531 [Lolium perenne]
MENEELAVFHRRRGAEQEWARIEAETTDAEPPCIVPANACHVWGMGLYHWISCFGQISYVRLAFQDATSKECEGSEKLEALEEKDLGTLLRVPQTGNTDPEAASEVEAPEAPGSSKRKRGSSSGPATKRAREVPSTAATQKLEAEKKRLKLIDTSNRAQPGIDQFFKSSGSGSQPPKIPKKRAKPSPASVPVTLEVEVPPKASSTAKPDPKDVINLDDLLEDPTDETGHGESDKGASSSAPPPEKPVVTSAEAPADEVEKKLSLSHATGTPQTHPHLFPLLQKVPLSQRHAEISAMMDQVWGPANTEEQELTDLESGLKVFFAKHKNNTRKLHEDLRVHVLEQMTEIEGLRQNVENSRQALLLLENRLKETAKRPAVDAMSAKIQVLEAENESLKNFLKESSEKETKEKKELLEKHTRDMAKLADKLKKSQQRVSTLAAKNKSQEAEAEAIDKMIFPSLGFEWTKDSTLKRAEAYDEARSSIDDLFEACCEVAKALNLKRAKTTVIDTMSKLMKQVPDLIKDWQESSARGVASLHDLPQGFSDAEDEEEEGAEEGDEEGSGSSADHFEEESDDNSGEGSGDGSGNDSGDGSAYVASDEEQSSE